MKRLSILLALSLAAFTCCQPEPVVKKFAATYSYKTSGTLHASTQDSTITHPLINDSGWMNIVEESENEVSIIKNTTGGKVIVIPARVEGDSLFYEYDKKVAVYFKAAINATLDVKIQGRGRLYDGKTIVISETYNGETPADTTKYCSYNSDFKVTSETNPGIVLQKNNHEHITVTAENVMTVAEKND